MARVSKYTLARAIFGDLSLEAGLFADRNPPHVTPQAGDAAWNDLINDYFSLTDANAQTISPGGLITLIDTSNFGATILEITSGGAAGIDFTPVSKNIKFFTVGGSDPNQSNLLSLEDRFAGIIGNLLTWDYLNSLGFGVGSLIFGETGSILGSLIPGPAIWNMAVRDKFWVKSGTPTTTDIPASFRAIYQDTSHSPALIKEYANDAGTLKGVYSNGQTILASADETQSSATVPNADTNVKTVGPGSNGYAKFIVEAEGYIQESLTSTQQDINIKLKSGGVQFGQTMKFNPQGLVAGAKTPFSIKGSVVNQTGALFAITIGAAAADANTTVFVNSLRSYGVV